MEKKIGVDFIQGSINRFQENVSETHIEPLLKLAALMVYYDPESIHEKAAAIFNYTPGNTEMEMLKIKSLHVNKKNEASLWILNDVERNKVLQSFISIEEMRELARKAVPSSSNFTQSMFNAYIEGNAPSLDDQDLDQLVATYSICSWLKETVIAVPSSEEVTLRIRRKEFLQPFTRLTKNFSGRIAELKRLTDYVDWFPKSQMHKQTASLVRQAFNWHDKPPMLIYGIGGVGKSTLVSQFILKHLQAGRREKLPFIYFDFDRPGLSLSEPMLLARHALQQLTIQFPESADVFTYISEEISNEYDNRETTSRSTDRDIFYRKYLEQFQHTPYYSLPILVVFDSFEELQFRAAPAELDTFFAFLNDLLSYMPRLRPVFIGRSEIHNNNMVFETVKLDAFDRPSALSYLDSAGIENGKIRNNIFFRFGGNPLTLQLAADLVIKDKILTSESFDDHYGKEASPIDERLIQQQLVQRNLDHIHDTRVRKIAVPGILVRNINPLVIQNVLAEPCGLGEISKEEAGEIYEALLKETFLITQTDSGICFRQDLRISLYDLICKSNAYNDIGVHNKAVEFYKDSGTPQGKAEYLYHRLMRGDDISVIDEIYNDDIRLYIESSLKEFDPDVYTYFAIKLGIAVPEDILIKASIVIWEMYFTKLISQALLSGDEATIRNLVVQLNHREERSYNSPLHYYEAKIYERLGNFDKALAIVGKAFRECGTKDIGGRLNLQLIECRIKEYQHEYNSALKDVNKFFEERKDFRNVPWKKYDIRNLIELKIAQIRLLSRKFPGAGVRKELGDLMRIVSEYLEDHKDTDNTGLIKAILPKPYCAYYLKDFPLDKFLRIITNHFYSSDDFTYHLEAMFRSLGSKKELDEFLIKRYRVNLKDICEPGVFEVNKLDALRYVEINNGQPLVQDKRKKRIIVCCDGIWNNSGFIDKGKPVKTNVEKIFLSIAPEGLDGTPQIKIYDQGLFARSGLVDRFLGAASTRQIDKAIKDVYTYIALNFRPGDDIYLFGFSRGAYVARRIAGFIRNCGILKNDSIHLVDEAYDLYLDKGRNTHPDSARMRIFREKYSDVTKIKFIGVWETVGALGIPYINLFGELSKYNFHNVVLSSTVEYAYQALAIDEKRKFFKPALWIKSKNKNVDQILEQRWFAGVHSNVGGGYVDAGLSDIALSWMMLKALNTGLRFEDDAFINLSPNPMGEIRESYAPLFWLKHPALRKIVLGDSTNQSIDNSVWERYSSSGGSYRPKNLKGNHMPEPENVISGAVEVAPGLSSKVTSKNIS